MKLECNIILVSGRTDDTKTREPQEYLTALESGGYLLSHERSTIGDAELNDPVRNGKGWDLSAIATSIIG